MTGSAKAIVHIDNEKVIVTEYRFAPGAKTGTSFGEMKKGVPYFRNEGVEHDVINANDTDYAFIEIELK